MKQLLLLTIVAISASLSAQLNATLRSSLDYDPAVNDVWGYVAPDGTEYAIVGLQDGISFVSLADPDNAVEVARIEGDNSNWRDMKTFGEYAYSVADQGDEGITAFDLRFLPDSVPFNRTQYDIPGYQPTFIRAHNLYIDTDIGRIYTSGGERFANGAGVNRGGILMFDINDNPMSPDYVGKGPEVYSHDVYVHNDTMYTSEIYLGELGIYDVSDLDNIRKLGQTRTPFAFTHNAWTTDDGQTVFTTDERENASVAAYDISDKKDIRELFQFRPLYSLNTETIPHNVHVIDDYLSISYYTDGLVVADASKPDNIIEVANWDTWSGSPGGFNGNWGAYPFLPSGLTLASDRSTGLYVVEVDYKRAARLEGFITDAFDGNPINNVSVHIEADQVNGVVTNATGNYKTGLANAGTYTVTFTADNYEPLTVSVDMANDVCLRLDTTLQSNVARFRVGATVVDDETGEVISNASFDLTSEGNNFKLKTDDDGRAEIASVFESDYELFVGRWGYNTVGIDVEDLGSLADTTIRLIPGYKDDFATDEGWVVTGDAASGVWERGDPIGTEFNGALFAPDADAPDDLGSLAFVTGNTEGGVGNNDVDDGTTTLTSPKFGPLELNDLKVSYQYWFDNAGGDVAPDDALVIKITNGIDTAEVKNYSASGTPSWILDSFLISDFITVNDDLQLIVETSDFADSGHLVEAGFDAFLVYGTPWAVSTENDFGNAIEATIFPNPTSDEFLLRLTGRTLNDATLRITDPLGRAVSERAVNGTFVRFGNALPSGVYFAELFENGRRVYVTKVMKE